MEDLQIIGDELHFSGHLVGVLAEQGCPSTIMAEFKGCLHEEKLHRRAAKVFEALSTEAKKKARGGLLKLSVLEELLEIALEELEDDCG